MPSKRVGQGGTDDGPAADVTGGREAVTDRKPGEEPIVGQGGSIWESGLPERQVRYYRVSHWLALALLFFGVFVGGFEVFFHNPSAPFEQTAAQASFGGFTAAAGLVWYRSLRFLLFPHRARAKSER